MSIHRSPGQHASLKKVVNTIYALCHCISRSMRICSVTNEFCTILHVKCFNYRGNHEIFAPMFILGIVSSEILLDFLLMSNY